MMLIDTDITNYVVARIMGQIPRPQGATVIEDAAAGKATAYIVGPDGAVRTRDVTGMLDSTRERMWDQWRAQQACKRG